MSVTWKLVPAVLAALLLAGCGGGSGGAPEIEVVGTPRAAEPAAGSSQVAITLANRGDGDDQLVGATTPSALGTELHRSEGGGVEMERVETIDLPAGEEVAFRPGQTHLMLVVPDETVRVGGTLELALEFERSEPATVEVEIVPLVDLFEDSMDEAAAETAGDEAADAG